MDHLPDGIEQRLTWDELDRIVAVETTNQRIVYEYDSADRLTRAATYHSEKKEPASDLLFSYDDKGRLTKEIQNGTAIEYRYDTSGRCLSRTSPSGKTDFSFDLLGQLKGLHSNGHALEFKRNSLGLETERCYRSGEAADSSSPVPDSQFLNAFSLLQSYDPCGRLKSQLAGPKTNYPSPAHERLAEVSRRYRWDKSGRLVGVKDNKRGASSYHYDPRDQINRITRTTGLDEQSSEQYSYDSLLNLVESNGRHHQYENGEVKSIGRSSYRHDSRGRLVEKRVVKHGFRPKTWHYRWDDFDRLTETHTPDGAIWAYTYDAFGRRIKKECVKAGESSKIRSVSYLWQGATLAEEHRTTGETTEVTRWHFEPGTFNPLAKETSGNFYSIVTDHLGTPKELFDTEGNCVWQAEHSLWGETTVDWQKMQQPDMLKPLVDCNLRFQNQWEDEESGLYYNLHRYYDPDSGQYLSTDPIGLEGGLRTHGYVNDPMQWVDPLGLAGCPNGLFRKGANITPRSIALQYRTIGRGGRTFVTKPNAITKVIGKLPAGNRMKITSTQARRLENELGLTPNSLESRNILSIVDNIPKRAPAAPISGNTLFNGRGAGLPGGGPELTIQGIPSAGGQGIRQIIVEVTP